MTHAQLVEKAVEWLRAYRCGVVLSEQACVSGEMPDAIGWKRASHSVLVECKISRAPTSWPTATSPFGKSRNWDWAANASISRPPALLQLEGTAARLGSAGIAQAQGRSHPSLRAGPPHGRRIGLRDESAAGQPAPRRNPHRAPNHHRFSEVEEPNGSNTTAAPCRTGIEPAQEEPNYFLETEARTQSRRTLPHVRRAKLDKVQRQSPMATSDVRSPTPKKENRAGWPGFYSVELRCGYITTRRDWQQESSGQFDQKCHALSCQAKIGDGRNMP